MVGSALTMQVRFCNWFTTNLHCELVCYYIFRTNLYLLKTSGISLFVFYTQYGVWVKRQRLNGLLLKYPCYGCSLLLWGRPIDSSAVTQVSGKVRNGFVVDDSTPYQKSINKFTTEEGYALIEVYLVVVRQFPDQHCLATLELGINAQYGIANTQPDARNFDVYWTMNSCMKIRNFALAYRYIQVWNEWVQSVFIC